MYTNFRICSACDSRAATLNAGGVRRSFWSTKPVSTSCFRTSIHVFLQRLCSPLEDTSVPQPETRSQHTDPTKVVDAGRPGRCSTSWAPGSPVPTPSVLPAAPGRLHHQAKPHSTHKKSTLGAASHSRLLHEIAPRDSERRLPQQNALAMQHLTRHSVDAEPKGLTNFHGRITVPCCAEANLSTLLYISTINNGT